MPTTTPATESRRPPADVKKQIERLLVRAKSLGVFKNACELAGRLQISESSLSRYRTHDPANHRRAPFYIQDDLNAIEQELENGPADS